MAMALTILWILTCNLWILEVIIIIYLAYISQANHILRKCLHEIIQLFNRFSILHVRRQHFGRNHQTARFYAVAAARNADLRGLLRLCFGGDLLCFLVETLVAFLNFFSSFEQSSLHHHWCFVLFGYGFNLNASFGDTFQFLKDLVWSLEGKIGF